MTDYNCDLHEDHRAKWQMRQFASTLFSQVVSDWPTRSEQEEGKEMWSLKARQFMVACDIMDEWLEEHENEEDYESETEENDRS